jgi:plasmid stabilization system protein ParE
MPLIEFHRLARAEVRRAKGYLARRRSPRTAARFAAAVDDAINRIAHAPASFASDLHGTRICPVSRFQYHIIFLVKPTEIVVVAVPHNRRRPGCWSRRLPGP